MFFTKYFPGEYNRELYTFLSSEVQGDQISMVRALVQSASYVGDTCKQKILCIITYYR